MPTTLSRILVAEDEMIVAFDLCETLEEAGFEIDGPHATVASAERALEGTVPDIALLDVSLQDDLSYNLAKQLVARGVAVVFHSGLHTRDSVRRNFPDVPVLLKPCPPAEVLEAIEAIAGSQTLCLAGRN